MGEQVQKHVGGVIITSMFESRSGSIREGYDAWYSNPDEPIYDEVLDRLLFRIVSKELGAHRTVLDVACGRGHTLEYLASRCSADYYGVDISKLALSRREKQAPLTGLLVGAGENLPYRDQTFDVVLCLGSLEHFSDLNRGVGEILRVMKNSGCAIILLPNAYFLGHMYLTWRTGEAPDEGGQQFSERFASRKQWSYLLEENGLRITKCIRYNHISYASKKVSRTTRMLYNAIVSPLLPVNLSYAFIFECRKASQRTL
jgi:ubiquinone/menaquinone biosynthesis C-methylase UbiE